MKISLAEEKYGTALRARSTHASRKAEKTTSTRVIAYPGQVILDAEILVVLGQQVQDVRIHLDGGFLQQTM